MTVGAPLRLGRFERSAQEYVFDANESLITIARPGRGKTQAHVIRNLLYLDAPAFVLDVKPEIYAKTAGWRQTIGPVMYFAPGDPKRSLGFNPLDFVPSDPIEAYRTIQQLVPLLIIPGAGGRPADFWEGRAAQMLATALFDVAVNNPFRRRDMTSVVDWFSPSPDEFEAMRERLSACGIAALERAGRQLFSLPDKVRESIFDSARRHVDVWGSPELEDIVFRTTFDLKDLRRHNGTLYLCVTPEELTAYATVIRTLFGLTFYTLRAAREDYHLPPVTFFMDEFPQLGYMREVERMIELGRQAGLRLWLFSQTKQQIQEAYRDADKILDMLAVRCFIEPTGKLAEEISKELGTERNIWREENRPLATAQQLMGPEYVRKVIALQGGQNPARLDCVMAFEDPVVAPRMELPLRQLDL